MLHRHFHLSENCILLRVVSFLSLYYDKRSYYHFTLSTPDCFLRTTILLWMQNVDLLVCLFNDWLWKCAPILATSNNLALTKCSESWFYLNITSFVFLSKRLFTLDHLEICWWKIFQLMRLKILPYRGRLARKPVANVFTIVASSHYVWWVSVILQSTVLIISPKIGFSIQKSLIEVCMCFWTICETEEMLSTPFTNNDVVVSMKHFDNKEDVWYLR